MNSNNENNLKKVINGFNIAKILSDNLREVVQVLGDEQNVTPGLAIIRVGDDPASGIYVANKMKTAYDIGIRTQLIELDDDASEKNILMKINYLNNDHKTHGIIVQLPLPSHLDTFNILQAISPEKDVDGFNPTNVGKLFSGNPNLVPCTALACIKLLEAVFKDMSGLNAVVIGRSNIVGKPAAELLLQRNCTVTMAHSKTQDLAKIASTADILIVAVGVPKLVKGSWVKPGAVVIDVGINEIYPSAESTTRSITGDVDFNDVIDKVSYITPVPKGVGPMTVICLMANTIKAACQIKMIEFEEDFF
ncbi:MAG: tetrahydrofolate dehydrogenase/cyclohydrolase catalytic domain-containing protein [Pseudomonadota bacterium]